MATIKELGDNGPDGSRLGKTSSSLIAFWGATPAVRRASSNQATTNIATSSDFGATQLAVVQEIMNVLIDAGLMKGSA